MPGKPNVISHICGEVPVRQQILLTPRRSYHELEQALQKAEQLTERTLVELLTLQQQQQLARHTDTTDKLQIQRQLQFMIKQGQRHDKSFALLVVELDHYQQILAQYDAVTARQVVDLALERMTSVIRDCDSLSLQGDGQFLLLITDVTRIYDVVLVAEKLMQKLALLNGVSPQPLGIEVSIGISRFPEDGNEAELLIERAAAAMRHAQRRGGNQFSFLR
ncbi:diguanylate cyclase (GGDEF) domain-containing protein [Arsukibacterium tuosuense]|uniref:Diguanylate cyclase (GGDEF) domain-containing protein n=1 Tax=Arsukibacterium tuosuense TaxID=1323745 RepID=A0A285INT5_9GAMM|nr:GGDEF domain-containing protein [Arsukibacterium tuosuense]SNY49387.1 diguanylate cyclase (GGDEF) domain-containing protein [Arsukibacterium tuosuense]